MSTLEQEKEFSQTAYRLMLDYARTAWATDTAAMEVMAQMLATVMIARAQDSIAATGIAQNRAAQRMAEAAERQAAAMERIAAAVEYATGKMHADISGDMLRIANEFMDGMKADDQRREDEAPPYEDIAQLAEAAAAYADHFSDNDRPIYTGAAIRVNRWASRMLRDA